MNVRRVVSAVSMTTHARLAPHTMHLQACKSACNGLRWAPHPPPRSSVTHLGFGSPTVPLIKTIPESLGSLVRKVMRPEEQTLSPRSSFMASSTCVHMRVGGGSFENSERTRSTAAATPGSPPP